MLAAGALLAGLLQGIHSKALLQRKTARQRHDAHKGRSVPVCEAAAGHAVCALLMLGMMLCIPSQILQSPSPFPQAANLSLAPHLCPTQPYSPIALSSQPCNPHHPTFPPPVPPLCMSQPDNSVIETCSRSGMMITSGLVDRSRLQTPLRLSMTSIQRSSSACPQGLPLITYQACSGVVRAVVRKLLLRDMCS